MTAISKTNFGTKLSDSPLTSHWASTEIFFVERGWGGCLFEGGCVLTLCAFRVGAYSRWAVNQINTVSCTLSFFIVLWIVIFS